MNNRFYKIGAAIGVGVIAFVIFCIVAANKKDSSVAQIDENNEPSVMSSTNIIENEEKEDESKDYDEIKKTNQEKKNDEQNNTKTSSTNVKNSTNTDASKGVKETSNTKNNEEKVNSQKTSAPEPVKDPTFKYPVEGEVTVNYAKDKLIYSDTLGEWVTHLGLDIKANKTAIVSASADGKVKSIKNDPRYGLTVVLEHVNGFCTVYSNLLTAEFVSVGENVKTGQTLGTVGNTASFEILDEPHLHFEIMKDGNQIDPNMYLKK